MSNDSVADPRRNVSPNPFDSRWFTYSEGETFGPYTGHSLREMAKSRQIVPTDLVALVGSSSWVQAKDDPVLRLLFVRPEPKPERSSRFSAKSGRRINLYSTLLVVGGLVWIAWPYCAAYDLARGLLKGDEAILQSRVDWESVRQGVRGDLNASLLRSTNADRSDLGRGLALVLGPTFVNRIVDGYVTPQAISRLVKADRSAQELSGPTATPAGAEIQKVIQKFSADQVTYAFFSGGPFTFRMDVRSNNKETPGVVTLIFRWAGDWQLTRVTLPLDDIEKFSAQTNSRRPIQQAPAAPAENSSVSSPNLSSAKQPQVNRQPLSQAELSAMRSRLASLWNIKPNVERPGELKSISFVAVTQQFDRAYSNRRCVGIHGATRGRVAAWETPPLMRRRTKIR
jgi:hypothetical protein